MNIQSPSQNPAACTKPEVAFQDWFLRMANRQIGDWTNGHSSEKSKSNVFENDYVVVESISRTTCCTHGHRLG
jgi:hypothetical protein